MLGDGHPHGVPRQLVPPFPLEFVEDGDYFAILSETEHSVRVIPLDGRPHRKNYWSWMGDSRGRWDGDTLVVDSTNFTDRTNFRGSGEHLHLVERFTRLDAGTLEYRFTVEDPTTWTRPWTVAYPMTRTDAPVYEYACHEGNYGLRDILSGARYEEQIAADAEKKRKP